MLLRYLCTTWWVAVPYLENHRVLIANEDKEAYMFFLFVVTHNILTVRYRDYESASVDKQTFKHR